MLPVKHTEGLQNSIYDLSFTQCTHTHTQALTHTQTCTHTQIHTEREREGGGGRERGHGTILHLS